MIFHSKGKRRNNDPLKVSAMPTSLVFEVKVMFYQWNFVRILRPKLVKP